ncbi:MAG: Gfo/Idh/MocA family oxidoreductase [Actinomycetota bacterium]|nr:Gfo/Idh/MocA family oxidoreductase [Actinomycetota bacterium]
MGVRFGLLGTGYRASSVHGPGLASHPGVDLVAVWGRDRSKAAELAGDLGCASTTDLDAMIGEVDAVAVALPPDVQAALATRAAAAGCHLLLDEPVALDAGTAEKLAATAEVAGVGSVVFFRSRFDPGLSPWWDQLRRGGWAVATYVEMGSISTPSSPYAGPGWRRERGALWDVGPHALATITVGLGPVETVSAVAGPGDTVVVSTGHRGGGVGCSVLALDAPPAARDRRATFYGERGVLHRPEVGGLVGEAYRRALEDLLATIADGRRGHPCDLRFGSEVVRVLAAVDDLLQRSVPEAG